jgi:hypothetical protein
MLEQIYCLAHRRLKDLNLNDFCTGDSLVALRGS